MAKAKTQQPKTDMLAPVRIRTLENLHCSLARKMASSFSAMQRSVVDCEIAFIDQTTYAEYIMSLSNPSCSYTFSMDRMDGPAILDFCPPVAYAFIDRAFGGTGANPPQENRPLTAVERSVMAKVITLALRDLEATWEFLGMRVSDAELETNPEFMQVANPSDTVLLLGFEVNTQHGSGLVSLCYPFETLFPVLKYLKPVAHRLAEAGPVPAATEARRRELEPQATAAASPDESLDDIATKRPGDLAGVVHAMLNETDDEAEGASAALGATALIGCLPVRLASNVLQYCSEDVKKRLQQLASGLKDITARQRDDALKAVREQLAEGDYVIQGAADSARAAVKRAQAYGFSMLRGLHPSTIVPFVSKEHPQTIALILSQLDAAQAAGVINGLPEELQSDVSFRIGQMENIPPQILRDLEDSLAQDLETALGGRVTEVGGPKAVAEILNHAGRSTETEVLERLGAQDAELTEEIRNQIFVFNDIAKLTDREIQMILREVDCKDLSVAMKGASEQLSERIFSNMSEEVGGKLKEEMEFTGPVRMSDVEEIQRRIVKTVRQLEEAGQITIARGDSNDRFV